MSIKLLRKALMIKTPWNACWTSKNRYKGEMIIENNGNGLGASFRPLNAVQSCILKVLMKSAALISTQGSSEKIIGPGTRRLIRLLITKIPKIHNRIVLVEIFFIVFFPLIVEDFFFC